MRKILFFLFIFICINCLRSQTIKGYVLNQSHEVVPMAQIYNSTSGNHTHSNSAGYFKLEASIGDTLIISHVSFISKTIQIQSYDTLFVQLYRNELSVEELIVRQKVEALNMMPQFDLQVNPVQSSQELLRIVPGLFIAQHAGGGKSEQIFLRGFDIDHGTDLLIHFDGAPVNMVSHAHGQGYSDLHFIIPETIDKIDFGKGSYYTDKGNFATAGYVAMQSKNHINQSSLKYEYGMFNSHRFIGMLNICNSSKRKAYLASEYLMTDGPFISPQNLSRINLFGKYHQKLSKNETLILEFSHLTSRWDASGQIPTRAVTPGGISRFGAIDDTEGGNTTRTNLIAKYSKQLTETSNINSTLFYSNYNFELFSNFTFFLEDSLNGDQIRQRENRNLLGFTTEYSKTSNINKGKIEWRAGLQIRLDDIKNNELSHTLNRYTILDSIQLGDVFESNMGAYFQADISLGKWTINPGVRADAFDFQYQDRLQTNYRTQSMQKAILSPKLNILFQAKESLQLYIKSGKGFHSNDSRVILQNRSNQVIPSSYGTDLGFIFKPFKTLMVNLAGWYLYLEQEFVYVGDAGIVEPSGQTQRQGIDLSVRYQPIKWLYWNIDATYSNAKALDEPADQNYIPLAPKYTLLSSLTIQMKEGLSFFSQVRYLSDRPANEDYSITAKGYLVLDANITYKRKWFNIGIQCQNLTNTEWNEAQFATESRLKNEKQAVEEIHFTPGNPVNVRGFIKVEF